MKVKQEQIGIEREEDNNLKGEGKEKKSKAFGHRSVE